MLHASLESVVDYLDLWVSLVWHQAEVDEVRLLWHNVDFLKRRVKQFRLSRYQTDCIKRSEKESFLTPYVFGCVNNGVCYCVLCSRLCRSE